MVKAQMASEKRYSFSTAATFDQAHKVIERRISKAC